MVASVVCSCSCSTRVRVLVRVSDRWQRLDNSVSVPCFLFKLFFVCHTHVPEHTWMGCWFTVMVCISVFLMNSHSEGFLDNCYFSFLLILKLACCPVNFLCIEAFGCAENCLLLTLVC
jgi:hypothetical protein